MAAQTGHSWRERLVRVVRIASINEADSPAVVQQLFRLLDCPADHATRLAGLNLAPDFDQGSVGSIETPREEHRDIEQGSWIVSEQAFGITTWNSVSSSARTSAVCG